MHWETRVHWVWGLLMPTRWFLFLSAMGGLGVLTFEWWGVLAALLLLTIAFWGFSNVWIHWRSFSLSFNPAERVLWERHGLVMVTERRINMGLVGSMAFRQTIMGQILDYGSLSIGALGGPYEWENLGHFRTLRRIVETQGEWMPRPRPVVIPMLRAHIGSLVLRAQRFWRDLWHFVARRPLRPGGFSTNRPTTPSYSRFLRFAESILFPQNTRRYDSTVIFSSVSGPAFTDDEIRLYYRILRACRILVTDLQGREHRHRRIRTLRDVQKRISVDWFQRAVGVF